MMASWLVSGFLKRQKVKQFLLIVNNLALWNNLQLLYDAEWVFRFSLLTEFAVPSP